MKSYICNKKVLAFKVTSIQYIGDDFWIIRGDGGEVLYKKSDWMTNRGCAVGGYHVIYKDGYTSWSPAEAFENGYKEI
jgi:hypothetical protein